MICNREFKNFKALGIHFSNFHHISALDYYEKFLKKENEGFCIVCKKQTRFISINIGYKKYCSSTCANLDPDIRNKIKKTKLEKYGDENYVNLEKQKQTMIERYGVENSYQSEEIKEKIKQIKKEKYGNEWYCNQKQARLSNFNRYGNQVGFASEQAQRKIEQTSMEKYGTPRPMQNNSVKENLSKSIYKKYGVKWPTMLEQNIKARMKAEYSKTHRKLYEILYKINNNFENDKIIENSKYIADIYLDSKKLIIECDGDYWHCNPNKYSPDFYHPQMKKTAQQKWDEDNNRKLELEELGYKVLRFWNSDINKHFDIILNKILDILKE